MVKWKKLNTQFYTVSVRTFVVPFYYSSGSGSGTAINYGSGSAKVRNYITVLVPAKNYDLQHNVLLIK